MLCLASDACNRHKFLEPTANLIQFGTSHRIPPPCAAQYSVLPRATCALYISYDDGDDDDDQNNMTAYTSIRLSIVYRNTNLYIEPPIQPSLAYLHSSNNPTYLRATSEHTCSTTSMLHTKVRA